MKKNERYTSIVIASFIPKEDEYDRDQMFKKSLDSFIRTTEGFPVEIIVVDNGEDLTISGYLDGLLLGGAIQCVIHNANNMHFGFARNQGINMACGEYIVIADNDILYKKGWLEACWEILEAYPEKLIYATPIDYPATTGDRKVVRYNMGTLNLGEKVYELDMRAGSNCFMVRERDLHNIGLFRHHRIAGTKWTDEAVHKGYLAAVAPGNLVEDMGLRRGYNHRDPIPVYRTLRDGSKFFLNQDEFQSIPNQ